MCYGTVGGKAGNLDGLVEGWAANTQPGHPAYEKRQAELKASKSKSGRGAPAAVAPLTIAGQTPEGGAISSPSPTDNGLTIGLSPQTRLGGTTQGSGLNVPL
jgi:hypothetical protein